MAPILQLTQINKTFKKLQALCNVSVKIWPSQILGIVGKSGCGKSTLAKIMIGLEPPDTGQIVFKGRALDQLKAKERLYFRKKVQIVFQNPYSSLNPSHTIRTTLSEPFLIHNIPFSEKTLLELLEQVQLPAASLKRYPHEFSGGERQRIAIARAMALQPECLILDEPTSALDVATASQIMQALIGLKSTFQLSMVLISHDLAHVKHLCDSITVIDKGRVVESGSCAAFFDHPTSKIGQRLIESAQFLDHMKVAK